MDLNDKIAVQSSQFMPRWLILSDGTAIVIQLTIQIIKIKIMRRRIQSQPVQVNFVFPADREFSSEEQEKAECMQLMPILLKLDYRKAGFN